MARKRILIVGGVAGGASAAARARRVDENAEITVFERGPYVSFANCGLPYFIAGEIKDRNALLVMTPEAFWHRARVDARVNHEVLSIDRETRTIVVRGPDGTETREKYDKLILSQGARPVKPPIPGVDQAHVFTLRDIPDMDRIATFLDERKPAHAAVIGGGFIGLEMAEAFHHRGLKVTVLERAPHLLPLLDSDMGRLFTGNVSREDFRCIPNAAVTGITGRGVRLETGEEINADLVLVSAGVRAEVDLAREAGLEIGETGGVRVNGRLESSDPDIYAVGDAAETTHALTGARARIALAGPANRQGRIAGANAAGGKAIYRGALGTSIVRVLDQVAAYTGLSSAQAEAAGFTAFTSVTRDASHAHYYPGAAMITTKLVVEEGTGRVLGAQVLGTQGVDKRIDVLATAISGRMSAFDLETLDLAYSPPFGSANDPVNVAGYVGAHVARADVPTVSPEEWKPAGETVLDVRDPDEVEEFGRLQSAVNIPLGNLRDRLEEIPRDRPVVTYCQKGLRGYLAACALIGSGFPEVANLRGGFASAVANGLDVVPPEP